MKKDNVLTIAAKAAPEPADVQGVRKVVQKLRDFNASAADRSILTGEDRRHVDELCELTDALAALETEARGGRAARELPLIVKRIKEYCVDTLGTKPDTLPSGRTVEIPVISAPENRACLKSEGDSIAAAGDLYCEESLAHHERECSKIAAADEALVIARGLPLVGDALNLYAKLLKKQIANPQDSSINPAIGATLAVLNSVCILYGADELPVGVSAFSLAETLRWQIFGAAQTAA